MNISFYDGINDGKFFNISAGKYDDLDDIDDINVDDIDISEEIEDEEEDDADTCINRFAALEKDASKLHMDLNNLRNEFKGSCKDWNNLSDTVDHMLNSIAEMKTIVYRADDKLNNRFKVLSEATAELADKLNLVEKKLEVFKCIDILDRVTKLEEQVKPTALEETKELEVRPSVLDNILDRLGKLEERYDTDGKLIGNLGRRVVDTDCNLSRLSDGVSKLDSKLAVTAKIVDAINGTTSGYGHDYVIIADRINELESKLKKLEDTKCDKSSPSVVDDILDRLGKLEEDSVSAQQSIASVVTKDIRDDVRLHSIDNKLKELKKKINEELDWKDLTGTTIFESIKNDILDSIKRLEEDSVSNDIQSDAVNHPSHYTDGKYETIDFIEEYGMKTHIGNAIKYTSRAGKKDEDAYVEDLKKGLWYLHRYNCPPKKKHIDAFDYCKDKKLPDELTRVIMYISRENYVEAERVLRKYIEELKK